MSLKLARDVLRFSGFETYEAINGEGALILVAESPPDLIVMDLQLPGIDGLDVTRLLKSGPDTRGIPD